MERQDLGARLMEASFFRIDGHVARAAVGAARPLRAPDRIVRLFSERLSELACDWDAGYGYDTVRLAVLEAAPLAETQMDFGRDETSDPEVAALVDRLGARLGTSRVTCFLPVDTQIPERAAIPRPLATIVAPAAWPMPNPEWEMPPERPLRLFACPEPVEEVIAAVPDGPPARFRWRRVVYEVRRAEGPERIAAEWWRPEDQGRATRDYYRVEDGEGRRYWLFREGLYGRETNRPAWFLHGLFG